MQTVLVDTDVAIDYLRGQKYAKDFMVRLWENSAAYLSVLSVYELLAGMKNPEKRATQNFIAACNIEPLLFGIAVKAGELYQRNRPQGITLTAIDCLVAATAIVRGHKIVTRNVRHYPDHDLLLAL